MVDKVFEIIKYFKPKYYFIENPFYSNIWNYVDNKKYLDSYVSVDYCAFGYRYKKPTKILTNKKLQDKNVEKASVSKTESKAKGKDAWKNYTTISQAKAAGSLFYSKNGKKMAAVLKEDLANIEGATAKEKLRNYLNKKLRNKKKMSTGGVLKQPDNPGLKKLPTQVRNKMGFMKKGGNVGHTDYRKAAKGMLLSSVDMMKKKKK